VEQACAVAQACGGGSGYDGDIFRLRAFLAGGNGEFNFLAFSQCLEAGTRDSTEMGEYIRSGCLLDEAEALSFVKPLYFASYSGHNIYLLHINNCPFPGGILEGKTIYELQEGESGVLNA
jgi:hypothetical protein